LGKRVTCLVDGFNLLFSARESRPSPGERRFQWLDVRGLLLSYLSVFGRGATLREIHFFTAIPGFLTERDPSAVFNFKGYLEALHSTGVHLHIATFKRKDLTCPYCGKTIERHEEKETDFSFRLRAVRYAEYQLPDPVPLPDGRFLRKPPGW